MAPDEVDLGIDGLPAGLAEDAAARILAAGDRGAEALAELTASWPQYEPGLRRVAALLAGTDRALASAFQPEEPGLPAEIGGHRVLRRLGEGSFGTVFLCAQERPVQREVAVKVLRPGAGDRQTLQRFAAERQLLASLHHPAITQVFDAGELPDGRPYFVMEHVAGEPLTAYCAARDLAIDARLRLFVDVCRGVAHAHRRGVVHRDLKPANVLVVDTDEGPRVKVIDFGIAKALHQSHAADGVHTDAGRVVGTPGYMSPEQAAGEAVDPRSDVFALGVMLYELATGVLPWPRGAATTDTEPTRPSAKVAARDAAGGSTSGRQKLASELRGDLDWITLKALARDATRRYADAAELADDLDRHLRGEPVHAGPPSAAYRLRKLVRRHRAAALAAAIAGVLLCATIAIAVAVLRTTRTAAEEHFAEAKQVVDRLVARANDPRVRNAPQSDRTRQLLLEDARQSYDRFLRRVPTDDRLRETHCRTLLALSDVSWQLGETQIAGRGWAAPLWVEVLDPEGNYRRNGIALFLELAISR